MCTLKPEDKQKIEAALTQAFHEIDIDKKGYIDEQEVEQVLKAHFRNCQKSCDPAKMKQMADRFINDLDANRDGKVELQEFIKYFLQYCNE